MNAYPELGFGSAKPGLFQAKRAVADPFSALALDRDGKPVSYWRVVLAERSELDSDLEIDAMRVAVIFEDAGAFVTCVAEFARSTALEADTLLPAVQSHTSPISLSLARRTYYSRFRSRKQCISYALFSKPEGCRGRAPALQGAN